MKEKKCLHRSQSTGISGVCAGVAEYFDLEPILTRILAVGLTVTSAGLLSIVYLAFWAIIPKKASIAPVIDVEPIKVHSETYGDISP